MTTLQFTIKSIASDQRLTAIRGRTLSTVDLALRVKMTVINALWQSEVEHGAQTHNSAGCIG